MLPQLARCILSEFGTMYVELQVAVDALPIATVTGPSPTKSALKKMILDLAAENDALSALNADLQSTIDGKVCTKYHASYIGTRSSDFSSDFSWIFLYLLPDFL